jgi:DNA-binding LacI/PurR family transcriptional regulator
MTRVTIEDVAAHAGVSVATVSRALRDLPNVAPTTRERVVAVARELDYQPDPAAARLATGRTTTVALAVPQPISWYFAQVVAGADAVLASAGYGLLLYAVDSAEGRHRVVSECVPSRRRVDGAILVELALADDEIEELASAQAAVVTIGSHTPHFDAVTIDNYGAARLAARHLIDLGHRHLALIGGGPDAGLSFRVPHERCAGFLAEVAECLPDHPPRHQQSGGFSFDGGVEAMERLLAAPRRPTGVFAMSDEMAMGAMKAVRTAGLRCPEDVSIIGIDDHDLADFAGLTTIRQPVVDHGAVAARLLLRRIAEPDAPTEVHLAETTLVVRTTTGPPP